MDDKGRLWMGDKLIGKMTFKETGVEKEKEATRTASVGNRHERRAREAMKRRLAKTMD